MNNYVNTVNQCFIKFERGTNAQFKPLLLFKKKKKMFLYETVLQVSLKKIYKNDEK